MYLSLVSSMKLYLLGYLLRTTFLALLRFSSLKSRRFFFLFSISSFFYFFLASWKLNESRNDVQFSHFVFLWIVSRVFLFFPSFRIIRIQNLEVDETTANYCHITCKRIQLSIHEDIVRFQARRSDRLISHHPLKTHGLPLVLPPLDSAFKTSNK